MIDFLTIRFQTKFQAVTKSTSCSNLRSLWETHLAQNDLRPQTGLNNRACPQPLNISAFQESFSKSSGTGSNPARETIDGELTKDAFKFFTENRSKPVLGESDTGPPPRPSNSSAIAALRESLMTSSSGTSQAKKLFEAGLLTNEAVQKFTEQRSGQKKVFSFKCKISLQKVQHEFLSKCLLRAITIFMPTLMLYAPHGSTSLETLYLVYSYYT